MRGLSFLFGFAEEIFDDSYKFLYKSIALTIMGRACDVVYRHGFHYHLELLAGVAGPIDCNQCVRLSIFGKYCSHMMGNGFASH